MFTKDIEKREKHEVENSTAEQMQHSGNAFSPDVDIYTSNDAVVFMVDLPGVGKGDVTIQVDETDTLVIRGRNTFTEPENAVLRSYNVGDFYRAFQLSKEYDKEKITAKLENGLLEITVPKREELKPRKIEISA